MISTTPTLHSAVHLLKCSTCGNYASSHTSYCTSAVSQVQTLQATLNRSLSTTLHVYGHPTALLADTGIPPLYITQNLQLAQFRFRLHSSPPDTFQHFLWNLWQPLLQVVPLDTLEDCMQTAICHVDPSRRDPASPLPHNISLAKQTPEQREIIQEVT